MIEEVPANCPFCLVPSERILLETESALALFDGFPVVKGHALVVPRLHVASIYDLRELDQAALWKLVGQLRRTLIERFNPDGFNIGVNDGYASGQTIGHAHIHVIPRYKGDVTDPRGGIRWVLPDKAKYW